MPVEASRWSWGMCLIPLLLLLVTWDMVFKPGVSRAPWRSGCEQSTTWRPRKGGRVPSAECAVGRTMAGARVQPTARANAEPSVTGRPARP